MIIPIKIEFDEAFWFEKREDTFKGKVVTETVTEYKEATDDADFTGHGFGQDRSRIVSETFPSLDNQANKSSPTKSKPLKVDSKPQKFDSKPRTKSDSTSGEEEDLEQFVQEALKAHNTYRKKHGVKSLKVSSQLCETAQQWADKLAKEDGFEHRPNCEYGENLYCSWSSNKAAKVEGKTPVDSWYSEVKNHEFGTEPRSTSSGHFTQVVWKASKEFGIGKARSKSGKVVIVANYNPPGNYVGQYAANVLPLKE